MKTLIIFCLVAQILTLAPTRILRRNLDSIQDRVLAEAKAETQDPANVEVEDDTKLETQDQEQTQSELEQEAEAEADPNDLEDVRDVKIQVDPKAEVETETEAEPEAEVETETEAEPEAELTAAEVEELRARAEAAQELLQKLQQEDQNGPIPPPEGNDVSENVPVFAKPKADDPEDKKIYEYYMDPAYQHQSMLNFVTSERGDVNELLQFNNLNYEAYQAQSNQKATDEEIKALNERINHFYENAWSCVENDNKEDYVAVIDDVEHIDRTVSPNVVTFDEALTDYKIRWYLTGYAKLTRSQAPCWLKNQTNVLQMEYYNTVGNTFWQEISTTMKKPNFVEGAGEPTVEENQTKKRADETQTGEVKEESINDQNANTAAGINQKVETKAGTEINNETEIKINKEPEVQTKPQTQPVPEVIQLKDEAQVDPVVDPAGGKRILQESAEQKTAEKTPEQPVSEAAKEDIQPLDAKPMPINSVDKTVEEVRKDDFYACWQKQQQLRDTTPMEQWEIQVQERANKLLEKIPTDTKMLRIPAGNLEENVVYNFGLDVQNAKGDQHFQQYFSHSTQTSVKLVDLSQDYKDHNVDSLVSVVPQVTRIKEDQDKYTNHVLRWDVSSLENSQEIAKILVQLRRVYDIQQDDTDFSWAEDAVKEKHKERLLCKFCIGQGQDSVCPQRSALGVDELYSENDCTDVRERVLASGYINKELELKDDLGNTIYPVKAEQVEQEIIIDDIVEPTDQDDIDQTDVNQDDQDGNADTGFDAVDYIEVQEIEKPDDDDALDVEADDNDNDNTDDQAAAVDPNNAVDDDAVEALMDDDHNRILQEVMEAKPVEEYNVYDKVEKVGPPVTNEEDQPIPTPYASEKPIRFVGDYYFYNPFQSYDTYIYGCQTEATGEGRLENFQEATYSYTYSVDKFEMLTYSLSGEINFPVPTLDFPENVYAASVYVKFNNGEEKRAYNWNFIQGPQKYFYYLVREKSVSDGDVPIYMADNTDREIQTMGGPTAEINEAAGNDERQNISEMDLDTMTTEQMKEAFGNQTEETKNMTPQQIKAELQRNVEVIQNADKLIADMANPEYVPKKEDILKVVGTAATTDEGREIQAAVLQKIKFDKGDVSTEEADSFLDTVAQIASVPMSTPAQAAGLLEFANNLVSADASTPEQKAKAIELIGDVAAASFGLCSKDEPVLVQEFEGFSATTALISEEEQKSGFKLKPSKGSSIIRRILAASIEPEVFIPPTILAKGKGVTVVYTSADFAAGAISGNVGPLVSVCILDNDGHVVMIKDSTELISITMEVTDTKADMTKLQGIYLDAKNIFQTDGVTLCKAQPDVATRGTCINSNHLTTFSVGIKATTPVIDDNIIKSSISMNLFVGFSIALLLLQ